MTDYKHGVYGEILASGSTTVPKKATTLPVYFGLAPVHQLPSGGPVGEVMLVSSFAEASASFGYSEDWGTYSLCEAMDAHFRNNIQAVGPVAFVNVFNPTTHRESSEKTAQLTFLKGRAEIPDPKLILSTLSLAEQEAEDYRVEWTVEGSGVVVTDLTGGMTEVTATYRQAAPEVVLEGDIVSAIKTVLPMVYQVTGAVPTLLAAPGWSSKKAVYAALCDGARKVDGHWYAYVAADLPATAQVGTPDKVLDYKKTEGLGNSISDLGWPCAKKGNRVYHLSTLDVVTMQRTDTQNDGIPYESPSNKALDITGLCLEDGTPVQFGQETANRLGASGIQSAIYWGQWVLWGSQTSGYQYGAAMPPEEQFGATVRMLQYLANDFQLRYGTIVDKPMKRSRVDTILNDTQERLDRYTSDGGILYGTISFEDTSNSSDDMVSGDFVFDISATTTPPGKSITAKLRWTDRGFSVLTGGEEIG